MTFRAATCFMLLGLTALLSAASGCGARSDLATGGSEASFRCANGSRVGAVGCRSVAFADPVAVGHLVSARLDEVAIADLNGDGALDLVVVGWLDAVTVFLNQGGGVFSDGVPYPTSLVSVSGLSADVSALAAGDVNQDGAVDLVVSPGRDDGTSVSVLLNDGHGAFAPGVPYPTAGVGVRAVALGDLNGDGRLDIATANLSSNDVSVLSNLGDGTFGLPVTHGPLENAQSITVADLDRDGRLDLVATFTDASSPTAFGISFFRNVGGGSFEGPILHPAFGGSHVVVGDVNGDGWPDLASDYVHVVDVFVNVGDGTFGDPAPYPAPFSVDSLAMADLNGDCRPDITSIGFASVSPHSAVNVLLNLGDGTFGPADTHVVEPAGYSIAAGDLDGDGKVDLAYTHGDDGRVSVLFNRGCGP
jgi:hypothetical protein